MEKAVKIKYLPESPKTRKGLGQMIRMDKSTGQNRLILIISVLGLVVQSMVSLTSSLRGQLVKCFITL